VSYQLIILPGAEKELRKLPRQIFLKVDKIILSLADNPRPAGCKKLQGFNNVYRIRVGNYRILYRIEDDQLIIEVFRIADRKDVYK
jgi:mRNA interferase RelE/StbE